MNLNFFIKNISVDSGSEAPKNNSYTRRKLLQQKKIQMNLKKKFKEDH